MKYEKIQIDKVFGTRLTEVVDSFTSKHFDSVDSKLNPPFLKVIGRGFLSSKSVIKGSVMFIGLNPSFQEDKTDDTQFNEKVHYQEIRPNENDYATYFKTYERIGEQFLKISEDISWSHIDLLYFRETNQGWLDKLLGGAKRNKGNEGAASNALNFVQQQLEISKRIIEAAAPRIIVITNTKARDMFGTYTGGELGECKSPSMGYHMEFDAKCGTYVVKSKGVLFNTPVFLSGMLTGQRALDIGSRERLVWHICEVLRIGLPM